jgi:hypothetical protein
MLETSFTTDIPINPEDLRVEFIDFDVSSDFTQCTYDLSLLSLDYELKSILYKDISYEFDFSCSNFKSLDIHLLVRNADDDWEVSTMSKDLFS